MTWTNACQPNDSTKNSGTFQNFDFKSVLFKSAASLTALGLVFAYAPADIPSAVANTVSDSSHLNSIYDSQLATANRYFYDQLTDVEKSIYSQLLQAGENVFSNADNIDFSASIASGASYNGTRVIYAFFHDNPQYFWVAPQNLAWSRTSGTDTDTVHLVKKFSDQPYFTDGFTTDNLPSIKAEFTSKVEQIVASAPADTQQKLMYFTNWLALNNTYNKLHLGASNYSRTAASGILSDNDPNTGPVCYGYTSAMKVLLDKAGIENVFMEGWAFNDKNMPTGEQHAWIVVNLEGNWYGIDPTWEDSGVRGIGARNQYFLVGADTVTQPTFPADRQKFKDNHLVNADKSPALRSHNFSLPTLSSQGVGNSHSDIELILSDGSSRTVATFEEATQIAKSGDTIRLWKPVTVNAPVTLSSDVKLDLNGQGSTSVAAITNPNGSVIDIANGSALQILNTGTRMAAIASGGTAPAIVNAGQLQLFPNVQVKTRSTGNAISTNAPIPADATYIVPATGGRSVSAYQVSQPMLEGQSDPAVIPSMTYTATEEDNISTLNGVVTNNAPQIVWKFLLPAANTAVNIPEDRRPATNWQLFSAPTTSGEKLVSGRYIFTSTGFGYSVPFAVDVTVPEPAETPKETPKVTIPWTELTPATPKQTIPWIELTPATPIQPTTPAEETPAPKETEENTAGDTGETEANGAGDTNTEDTNTSETTETPKQTIPWIKLTPATPIQPTTPAEEENATARQSDGTGDTSTETPADTDKEKVEETPATKPKKSIPAYKLTEAKVTSPKQAGAKDSFATPADKSEENYENASETTQTSVLKPKLELKKTTATQASLPATGINPAVAALMAVMAVAGLASIALSRLFRS